MSRRFTLLAAVVAFCGLSAVAQAQSGSGAGESTVGASAAQAAGGGMATRRTTARRPAAYHSRTPARRTAARNARPARATGSDAAYQGGGAIYERGPDGSLRPVN